MPFLDLTMLFSLTKTISGIGSLLIHGPRRFWTSAHRPLSSLEVPCPLPLMAAP